MKEYIVIIAQHDIYTKQIMNQLLDGTISEIKYVGQEQQIPTKSVSRPKVPDSKAQKEIFEQIREEQNGKKLLEMIKNGEIDN